jgi:restriction endonuclease S subunit
MKDSGAEWIGEMPAHWDVKRLKDIIKTLESGSREKGGASDKGIFSLSAEHINWDGHFNFTSEKFVAEEHYEKMTNGKIRKGDTLLTKDGATIGKCAYIDRLYFSKMAINEHMFLIRCCKETDDKFLYYLITSPLGRFQTRGTIKTTAIPGINSNFIMDVFFRFQIK